MVKYAKRRTATPVLIQCGLLAISGSTLLFVPAADGAMLLIPARGNAVAAVNAALANGARLIAAGPLPGSMIVAGRRDLIVPAVLSAGAVAVAARAEGCGEEGNR